MNLEQFRDLADAYGADLRRWPADRQVEARVFSSTQEGRAALAGAAGLDDLLDASRPRAPSSALRSRVLASAPKPKASLGLFGFGWRLKAGIGASLASAGLAGVAAGFALNTAAMEPAELALSTLAAPASSTAFGPAPEAQED